jgi:hypothetical protein
MPDFEDWDVNLNDAADQRAYAWDVIKTGLRFLVFTCLLYTFIIWGFANLLVKSDILSGDISWQHAGMMSVGIIFLRMWDRTFFK